MPAIIPVGKVGGGGGGGESCVILEVVTLGTPYSIGESCYAWWCSQHYN